MAIAQMIYQVAMETGVVPPKIAVRRLFQAARVPDIAELVPDDVEPQPYDPVGEIQALFLGKPVKVAPEQPHVMHLQVLGAFASNPQYGGNEQVQKQIGPQLLSVIGQHMAYAWATHARGLGAPAGYMDPQNGQVIGGQGSPEQIAAMLAQVAPQLATVPGLPPINPEGGKEAGGKEQIQIEYAKLEIEREKHRQEMQQSAEKHRFELEKEASKLEAEKQMNAQKAQVAAQKAQSDLQIAQVKAQQGMQQAQMDNEIKQQQAANQMQADQQQAQQQAAMDQHKMQQEAAMGQQEMAHKQQQTQQEMHLNAQKAQQQAAVSPHAPAGGPADRLQHLRGHKLPPHGGGDGSPA
jgi:hypothetical protein